MSAIEMANMFKEANKDEKAINEIKTHRLRGIEVDDFKFSLKFSTFLTL